MNTAAITRPAGEVEDRRDRQHRGHPPLDVGQRAVVDLTDRVGRVHQVLGALDRCRASTGPVSPVRAWAVGQGYPHGHDRTSSTPSSTGPWCWATARSGRRCGRGGGRPTPSRGRWPGKRVLVTGATSGIGEAMARSFADLGATVHVHGRNADKLAGVARQLRLDRPAAEVRRGGLRRRRPRRRARLGRRLHGPRAGAARAGAQRRDDDRAARGEPAGSRAGAGRPRARART